MASESRSAHALASLACCVLAHVDLLTCADITYCYDTRVYLCVGVPRHEGACFIHFAHASCLQWTIFFLALITDAFRIVCLLWLFVSAAWLAFQLLIHREEAGMITKGEHVKIGALQVDTWSSRGAEAHTTARLLHEWHSTGPAPFGGP